MALNEETVLERDTIDAFLSSNETGVLTLADADEPYGIPISYGYDAANQRFYLRLVSTPESEKRRFLASSPMARIVVYEADDDVYHSVIASGNLEEIPRDALSVDDIEQYGQAKRPLFEIWGETKQDLDVRLYKLDSETLSGRRIVIDRQ